MTFSLIHGNEYQLFHVDERTGAVTTTRLLPATQTVYRLVIAARDHGEPPSMTIVDVDIAVNDSAVIQSHAGFSQQLASHSLLTDDRFFVVLGIVSGIVVVSLLALVVCAVLILRHTGKPWRDKPRADTRDHKDASSLTESCLPADNCTTSSDRRHLDWDAEYSKMISVSLNRFFYLFNNV